SVPVTQSVTSKVEKKRGIADRVETTGQSENFNAIAKQAVAHNESRFITGTWQVPASNCDSIFRLKRCLTEGSSAGPWSFCQQAILRSSRSRSKKGRDNKGKDVDE